MVRVYSVRGDSISGFREVKLPRSTTEPGAGPQTFRFPTFRDPEGKRDLVQVLRGALAGEWVSPEDSGVSWTPDS